MVLVDREQRVIAEPPVANPFLPDSFNILSHGGVIGEQFFEAIKKSHIDGLFFEYH